MILWVSCDSRLLVFGDEDEGGGGLAEGCRLQSLPDKDMDHSADLQRTFISHA